MQHESTFITVGEAARMLHVSRAALYGEISKGRLRSVLIAGRNRRISREALAEYIAEAESRANGTQEVKR